MPLPTRRAIRPDSRHHREARRQRLSRGGGPGARRFWNLIAVVSLIAFMIAALVRMFGAEPRVWVMPTIYTSIAALVVSVIVMLFGMRG